MTQVGTQACSLCGKRTSCPLFQVSAECNSAGRTALESYVPTEMPELAEVEWYRKQWDAGRGDEVVDVSLHKGKYVFRGTSASALQEKLIGKKFLGSTRRGKQMLFQFSGDNWLGIHLGMTGKTHVEARSFRSGKYDHLVLYQRKLALVFTDPRQLGHLRFHHGPQEPAWWKRNAPEIDSRDFDQKLLDKFLDRHRKAPIKYVLIMQSGFPGIGNWMADEILWRAKVLPSKRAGKLNVRERAAIFRAAKFVVRRSLETLGKDFSDPPKNWLIHQKWKRGGVCPRHRIPLRHATIGGRTTAWCARCQH
jgi:formamidopyrimidine-DNA glycosylase